ncbi:MAG: phage portal protein [archaeon]|nr:phage portal protein [archaeon]
MENKKHTPIKVFNFNKTYEVPVNKIDKRNGWITWGQKNDYPDFLLNLYDNYGGALHKSIINKKVKYISGRGFNDVQSSELNDFIKKNKLTKQTRKATLDYEIFNAFAFEIVYANDGSLYSVKHIPISKVRIGIEDEEINFPHVYISKDWSKYKKEGYEPEIIRQYNPYVKTGKQIFLYFEYSPAVDWYSTPQYSSSINYVELSYEISKFHLNQAKQGYAPQFLLDFKSSSIPTTEEMDEFSKAFEKEYAGTEGNNIIITYSENEGGVELTPIQLNDSDERFIALNETITENIVQASEIPPQLVILTPGKLGSTEERMELQKEFQEGYVTPRQEVIEEVLNEILSQDFNEEIKLKNYNEE